MMIKAVLLDMDGLLFDSEPLQYQAIALAFKKFGVELTREDFVQEYFINSKSSEDILKEKGLEKRTEEFMKIRRPAFHKLIENELKPMPHVMNFLSLVSKNFKTALVTNTWRSSVMQILEKFGIRDKFDSIICREDYEKRKPDPESYLVAAKKLGVSPEECLVFEDTPRGMLSAKNAGMKCVVVPNRFTKNLDFKEADFVFSSLKEIDLNFIKRL